jgi:cell division topological specificity factor
VKMDRGDSVSTLEVDIELPNGFEKRTRLPANRLA